MPVDEVVPSLETLSSQEHVVPLPVGLPSAFFLSSICDVEPTFTVSPPHATTTRGKIPRRRYRVFMMLVGGRTNDHP